jgi:hypothetical protein
VAHVECDTKFRKYTEIGITLQNPVQEVLEAIEVTTHFLLFKSALQFYSLSNFSSWGSLLHPHDIVMISSLS